MKLDITKGLAVAVLGLAAVACSGENTPPPPATTTTQPAAAPATTSMPTTVAAGDFGVPACDQYMRKYAACVDSKVPEAARATMKQSMMQTHLAWKQAASTPEGRTALTASCTQAEAMAKQAMASYGCEW